MENTEFQPFTTPPVGRNTFLTVICILTFIGSGWGIGSGIYSYIKADQSAAETAEKIEQAQDKMTDDSPGFLKNMMDSAAAGANADNIRKSSLFSIFSCLLTLGGAILMWRLSKNGFYLYLAGTIIAVATPIIVIGGMIGMIGAASNAFVGLIFCILYGVNLKHMS